MGWDKKQQKKETLTTTILVLIFCGIPSIIVFMGLLGVFN